MHLTSHPFSVTLHLQTEAHWSLQLDATNAPAHEDVTAINKINMAALSFENGMK